MARDRAPLSGPYTHKGDDPRSYTSIEVSVLLSAHIGKLFFNTFDRTHAAHTVANVQFAARCTPLAVQRGLRKVIWQLNYSGLYMPANKA